MPLDAASEEPAPGAPARPFAAWAVGVTCLALFAASVALDAIAPTDGPGSRYVGEPGWPFTFNGLFLGALAVPILLRRHARMFGWLLGGLGVFWALDGLAQSYIRAGVTDDGVWPGMTFAVWFLDRLGAFLSVWIMAALLYFPNGRLLPGWRGVVGRAALGLGALACLSLVVMPFEVQIEEGEERLPPSVDIDPTTIDALAGVAHVAQPLVIGALYVSFVAGLALIVVRYRRSRGLTRDRMRWLAWSIVVIAVFELVTLTVLPIPGTDFFGSFVGLVLPGAAMTVAVVRPQLVPIEDLLGRTVVIAVVLAALVAADVVVLTALTLVLDDDLTQAQVVAVVLIVAVALYGPLRQRLSAAVRRRMLGERDTPTTRWRASPRPSRRPTTPASSCPRSPGRSRRRSAWGS